MKTISRDYLIKLLDKGIRVDERKLEEYREIKIENNISKNAEGSARVKIGDTEVLAGVKMEVGTPYPDKPNEGTIIVGAEFLQMANPDFESGPPSAKAIELARVVDRGIRESKTIDFKKLCITKGEKVWLVLIDIYIANDDGNLQDAASLAAISALINSKIPSYDGERVDYSKKKDQLPLVKKPIECTVYKIGKHLLVDPCLAEFENIDARLTVAFSNNNVNAMQKGGDKIFTVDEIEKALKIAKKKTDEIGKLLK